MIKSITQEAPSGCAVACVAMLLEVPYRKAILLFRNGKSKEIYQGYYCKEIVAVLKKKGVDFRFKYVSKKNNRIYKNGTIVFIKRTKEYPKGHYLIKTLNGWMDPWINMPKMNPAKSGLRKKLPGEPIYAVLQTD